MLASVPIPHALAPKTFDEYRMRTMRHFSELRENLIFCALIFYGTLCGARSTANKCIRIALAASEISKNIFVTGYSFRHSKMNNKMQQLTKLLLHSIATVPAATI